MTSMLNKQNLSPELHAKTMASDLSRKPSNTVNKTGIKSKKTEMEAQS